ncbi:MAG: DUF3987 domain-containing protein [Lutibacter sp.]
MKNTPNLKYMVSRYEDFKYNLGNSNLIDILRDIKSDKYESVINSLRYAKHKGEDAKADEIKNGLIGFTTSGTFGNTRTKDEVISYSQVVCIDFDDIPVELLNDKLDKINECKFTLASFISPSGEGIKVFTEVNCNEDQHTTAYNQVAMHYQEVAQFKFDVKCKDVTRLCFISYDPNTYVNEKATVFEVLKESPLNNKEVKTINPVLLSTNDLLNKCLEFTQQKEQYLNGNRNNFIYLFASNANRFGIYEDETLNYCATYFDLNNTEIKNSVNSAYKHKIAEFAKFADFANYNSTTEHNPIESVSTENALFSMPFLPDDVFDKLPEILKKGCSVFKDRRERDVFLTSALSVISGCMVNVSGGYRGKKHYANLFSFIIAPAASGKGSITFSKDLGNKYHEKLVNESKEKQKLYAIKLREYNKKIADKKQDTSNLEPPTPPPFKVLYIPANNSSARVIEQLLEGDEQGIFCETEADTMGNVFSQDWGGYSVLLRNAFHHEPITYSRKTNKEWVEIKQPRLSVALAGTPSQVEGLIKSAEDGLFSRFIFYTFKSELKWIDAGETMGGINLTDWFDVLSNDVLNFVEYLGNQNDINFSLTESQWIKLNLFGKECLNNFATFISEDLSSTSKRLGLILYRISMLLTALRYFDNGETSANFICEDEDFDIALQLIKIYQEHSAYMFKELPKKGTITDKVLTTFYNALPFKFQRKDAIEIAETKFQIKERTADLYLSKLDSSKYLEKIKSGFYQKIQ